MRSVLVGCVVAAMAGSAVAQPGLTPPSRPGDGERPDAGPMSPSRNVGATAPTTATTPSQAPAQPTASPAEPRRSGEVSENHGLTLALGLTLASWSVVAVGIAAESAPIALTGAVGTLITPSVGNWHAGGSAAPWLGMRVVGLAAMMYGFQHAFGLDDGGGEEDHREIQAALLGGLGLYLAGTIIDLATAPSAARRHNRELRALTVAPLVHGGGGGLAIGGAF